VIRQPHIALRPFVRQLWISDHQRPPQLTRFTEHALPDGRMHLVIRLHGTPIHIVDARHPAGHNYGYSVIGGARASFYQRELAGSTRAIGATLLPGAAQALFGISALEFADRHTGLTDVWGLQIDALRERLLELDRPELQLELLELFLLARLPRVKGIHPAIARALSEIDAVSNVRSMVSNSGMSHRRFTALFAQTAGLTPKKFSRVLRFQRMLKALRYDLALSWADIAQDAGYSDQPHFNREFREISGLTPEQYRRIAPQSSGHVVVTNR
jgi:AraC-like DNA-binding protein